MADDKGNTYPEGPAMIRIADAARLADVSEDAVMRWISAGHLRVFTPPGHKIGDGQRGPKSVRILVEDWHAFVAAHTGTGMAAGAEPEGRPRAGGRTGSHPEVPTHRNRRRSGGPA